MTRTCSHCRQPLTDDNWWPSRRSHHDYVCKRCCYKRSGFSMVAWNAAKRARLRAEARALLGGVCQLCAGTERLEFAHVWYVPNERRDSIAIAVAVLATPNRFLLLCKDCHTHPERYFVELIEARKTLTMGRASDLIDLAHVKRAR